MRKVIFTALLAFLAGIHGCKNPCKGEITYTPVDSRLLNYVFMPGSYWVYMDTVDGIRDSQYVYSYTHLTHHEYLNPDTITGINHNDCLAPFYTDELQMSIMSFYNNTFNDTLAIGGSFTNSNGTINTLSIYEHFNLPNQTGIPAFILDYTQVGLVENFKSGTGTSIDTSSVWYVGLQSSVSSGAYSFSNVNVWRIQNASGNSVRFSNPTDLYFASGYGIIKIVEHRPTGDVSHYLANYKIIN